MIKYMNILFSEAYIVGEKPITTAVALPVINSIIKEISFINLFLYIINDITMTKPKEIQYNIISSTSHEASSGIFKKYESFDIEFSNIPNLYKVIVDKHINNNNIETVLFDL